MEITAAISTAYTSFSPESECADNSCAPADKPLNTPVSTDTYEPSTEKNNELSEEEKRQVQELSKRDQEVRAHEMAHVAAAGQYAQGGANFEFQTGPDGKRYAVGGEVSIDTSAVPDNPEATVRKMQVVKRAALAPSQPSGQDRAVAAQASQKEIKARQEMHDESSEEMSEKTTTTGENKTTPSSKTARYSPGGRTVSLQNSDLAQLYDITA